jgi:hypothetical protein
MTSQLRFIRALAVSFVALLAAAGCASTRYSSARPHSISIFVKNNLTVPTTVEVYIIGPGGTQWRLGQVNGGDSAEFSYRPDSYGQRYRLLARRPLERPVVSTPFTFGDANTRLMYWALIPGIVTAYEDVATQDTVAADPAHKVGP